MREFPSKWLASSPERPAKFRGYKTTQVYEEQVLFAGLVRPPAESIIARSYVNKEALGLINDALTQEKAN
jgi:hypothetical protein